MTDRPAWTRTKRSSSCTPRTGARWSGSRCCWCATTAPPRRSSRTRSSPCTRAGRGCATRTRRWPTCARPSSTGPARRCATAASSSGTPPPCRPVDTADPTPDSDRRDAVLDAMRALPDRQREVLALRYYLDLSEAEIADTLGISRGAVKSHASAAPPRCAHSSRRTTCEHPCPSSAPRRRRRRRADRPPRPRSGPYGGPDALGRPAVAVRRRRDRAGHGGDRRGVRGRRQRRRTPGPSTPPNRRLRDAARRGVLRRRHPRGAATVPRVRRGDRQRPAAGRPRPDPAAGRSTPTTGRRGTPGSFESATLGDDTIDVEVGSGRADADDLAVQQVVYTLQGAARRAAAGALPPGRQADHDRRRRHRRSTC